MKFNANTLFTSVLITLSTVCMADSSSARMVDDCTSDRKINFIVLAEENQNSTGCVREAAETIYNPNSDWRVHP